MSKTLKTFFSDHHSAIVSIVVVLVVVIVGAVLMDGFNGNTLNRAQASVDSARRELNVLLDLRFELASELSHALQALSLEEGGSMSDGLNAAVSAYRMAGGAAAPVSSAYNRLDDILKQLQRTLILRPSLQENPDGQSVVRLLKALGECEDNLVGAMSAYEDAALQLERRIDSFPMNFSASRRGISKPSQFSIQQALQTRP